MGGKKANMILNLPTDCCRPGVPCKAAAAWCSLVLGQGTVNQLTVISCMCKAEVSSSCWVWNHICFLSLHLMSYVASQQELCDGIILPPWKTATALSKLVGVQSLAICPQKQGLVLASVFYRSIYNSAYIVLLWPEGALRAWKQVRNSICLTSVVLLSSLSLFWVIIIIQYTLVSGVLKMELLGDWFWISFIFLA